MKCYWKQIEKEYKNGVCVSDGIIADNLYKDPDDANVKPDDISSNYYFWADERANTDREWWEEAKAQVERGEDIVIEDWLQDLRENDDAEGGFEYGEWRLVDTYSLSELVKEFYDKMMAEFDKEEKENG